MNNKKGFTIIEVVLAFTFAVILLASMFIIVINYQNKTEKEKIKSNLLTYKNSILEIVYHDIISNNIDSMSQCGTKCIEIKTSTETFKLEGNVDAASGNNYLTYRGNNYVLPDSNNNLSIIDNFDCDSDGSKIFKVNIPIIHAELDDEENNENTIEIVISGKEFTKPVSKLENPVVIKPITGLEYNDVEYELIKASKYKGDIYFSTGSALDDSNYISGTNNIPKKKDANTYTVYYYVTGNDDYYSKSGSVTVNIGKRKVTYKADDAKKTYDGTVLEKKTATLIEGTLVEGHTATFDIDGSITTKGEVPNVLKEVIIKRGNDIVTDNYDITKVNGKLIVEQSCGWVLTSRNQTDNCTSIPKTSNPVEGSKAVECTQIAYKGTKYTLYAGSCANGYTISSGNSGYSFTSATEALGACMAKAEANAQVALASGNCDSVSSLGRCTTQSKYIYDKEEETYQCSDTKDTITINAKTATYTGSPISANTASILSTGTVTYTYYSGRGCTGTPLTGAPTNAGEYSVNVISSGDKSYLGNNVCIDHTITKATPVLTISPTNGTVVKGKTLSFTEKANVAGNFENESVTTSEATLSPASYSSVEANTSKSVTVTGKEVGSSKVNILFTPTDATNYNTVSGSYDVTIINNTMSCTFSGPANSWLKASATTTFTLTCTDSYEFSDSDLTSSDFTLSTSGTVTLSTPTKSSVTNGYKYTITVTGAKQGTTTLTLKSGVLSDIYGATNAEVTSLSVGVDTTRPTVSYNVAGGTYTTNKTVTITASDTGGSGFKYMDVHVYKNGTMDSSKSVNTRTSSTYSVTLEVGNSWVVYTTVYDKAGNTQNQTPDNGAGWYYQEYNLIKTVTPTGMRSDDCETNRSYYDTTYTNGNKVEPNNYVKFNNELWRIIAKETDGTWKIMRSSYVSDTLRGWGPSTTNAVPFSSSWVKDWCNSYYNGLPTSAKNQIVAKQQYIGVYANIADGMKGDFSDACDAATKEKQAITSTTHYVTIPYVSDYVKADSKGFSFTSSDSVNWMRQSVGYWVIGNRYANSPRNISAKGEVQHHPLDDDYRSYYIVPVVYLKSSTIFTSGNGTSSQPYIIG